MNNVLVLVPHKLPIIAIIITIIDVINTSEELRVLLCEYTDMQNKNLAIPRYDKKT